MRQKHTRWELQYWNSCELNWRSYMFYDLVSKAYEAFDRLSREQNSSDAYRILEHTIRVIKPC